jgi:pyruvate formate lyase activating enzyme
MRNRNGTDPVVVGGFTPLTTIDYPGELSAVVFLQGCPWRCGYCQNNDLIACRTQSSIPWQNVIDFLDKRRRLLDAVVFSGGEPTLHANLAEAIQQVSAMGFKVGLHTAGIYPNRLQKILPLVDWVGMDIKSAKTEYESITGVRGSGERAWKSANLLLGSGVAHEFRTTVHQDMLSKEQLASLVDELSATGAEDYVIQECITKHCLDESRRRVSAARIDMQFIRQFADRFNRFSIRSS